MDVSDGSDRLVGLVKRLAALPREVEWVEFKENVFAPEKVGEYISAMSNSAALCEQPKGYIVWGVADIDHQIAGTTVDPYVKVGNEDLRNWLLRGTRPQVHFEFHTIDVDGKRIVVLEVDAAHQSPIRFQELEWIRIGSHTKKLRDHPDHARRLWNTFNTTRFEHGIAAADLDESDVLQLLDYPSYFDLNDRPLPETRRGIIDSLEADDLIRTSLAEEWSITNLGAVLFAKDITAFPSLQRKALRIVQYHGNSRVDTIREQTVVRGYASGFAGAIDYLMTLLPSNEIVGRALRSAVPMFPELAIRELVANALVHQDFSQTGNGPMVEVFDQRIEITSPGSPLVPPARFIDAPPKSRNELLASMMRRIGVCEERGTGWDKIVSETEFHQLPAPLIELPEENTRVVLFGPKPLAQMTKDERTLAMYLHACLRYVVREQLTNSSVRERFGIESKNSAAASRLISEAVEASLIIPLDAKAGRRFMRYVPFWARG